MSEQERKQDGIIAMIFAKFDTDGSGALDLNELVELFDNNKVKLSKKTVTEMF
jgi:Ca2+-binding EF-hand superfamily protein